MEIEYMQATRSQHESPVIIHQNKSIIGIRKEIIPCAPGRRKIYAWNNNNDNQNIFFTPFY